jgi:hypothetical protein
MLRIVLCVALVATASAYTALNDTMGPVGTRVYHHSVNPPAHQRIGEHAGKTVWAYAGPATQGAFGQVYHPDGLVTAEDLLSTPVNQVAFILNVDITGKPSGWFAPGKNNTGGCGQYQTYEIPFGYECARPAGQPHGQCDDSASLPKFQANLKKMHDAGMTITLTLGSWCTELPVKADETWSEAQFTEFVDYFEEVKEHTFGGFLDGIDFDWEGYCSAGCLQGTCACGWDDKQCGTKTPDQLANGVYWEVSNIALDASGAEIKQTQKFQCWILPTTHTIQVMTGITYAMKKAGHVVTLVPMSTSLYSGTESGELARNEYVKYRKQAVGAGGAEVDLLDMCDGILLQWYSGFDAALCRNSKDPKACSCDNTPAKDYQNVVNASEQLLVLPWQTLWNLTGNSFPTTFPLRCQACGKDVYRKDKSTGEWGWGEEPCAPKEEEWYVPCSKRDKLGANLPECVAAHNNGIESYAQKHHTEPHWWPKGVEVASKCPRGIDCPDWRYEGEKPYSRQINLLKSIQSVVDLKKVAIGFETLGIDVLVQLEAYQDQGLPWSTANPKKHQWPIPYDELVFYEKCTQNMTFSNYKDEKRCMSAIGWQQWGLKFDAKDVVGLEKAVEEQLGTKLSGVGLFTLDGVIAQSGGKKKRFWCEELMKLNETYKIPCKGPQCGQCGASHDAPTPGPAPRPSHNKHGDHYVTSGETCYKIAQEECGTGTSCSDTSCPAICNAGSVCSGLQVGADVKYDCSGSGKFC